MSFLKVNIVTRRLRLVAIILAMLNGVAQAEVVSEDSDSDAAHPYTHTFYRAVLRAGFPSTFYLI